MEDCKKRELKMFSNKLKSDELKSIPEFETQDLEEAHYATITPYIRSGFGNPCDADPAGMPDIDWR